MIFLYIFDFIGLFFWVAFRVSPPLKELMTSAERLISGFDNPLFHDPALDYAPGAQVLHLHAIPFYAILLCLAFHGGGEVITAGPD